MHLDCVSLGSSSHQRVVVRGELDLSTAVAVRVVLADLLVPGHVVELDLSQVTFMDTSGAHLLAWMYRKADRVGATATVGAVSPPVQRLLALARAERLLVGLSA